MRMRKRKRKRKNENKREIMTLRSTVMAMLSLLKQWRTDADRGWEHLIQRVWKIVMMTMMMMMMMMMMTMNALLWLTVMANMQSLLTVEEMEDRCR